ncbi:DUF3888 domain-containing protein [Paenibacillus qinlingensis]|uniref:DUF3888 domain-containing protein n=1 Tax=Paenibacillus qinlingensis TaxID=1837343 RepID=A0ABU1P8W6_9BACL|nr:DUF3888 domain-containing protein [Paenibacillus qinlingensis]MDR6555502.1 hypothetical protein [Paenibacillus qinlingensis]
MNVKSYFGLLLAVFIFSVFTQPVYAKPQGVPLEQLVLTLLTPSIQEQINRYYKDKLTVSPKFSPFLGGTELNVQYYPSHIDVKVTVIPYVGPHLDVGMDSMKFRVDNTGVVMIQEYKHIRDYESLPNWQHILR